VELNRRTCMILRRGIYSQYQEQGKDALHFDSTYQDRVNLSYSFYTGVRTLSTKFKPDITTYSTYPTENLLAQYLGGSNYSNRSVLFRIMNGIFAVFLNIGNNYTYLYSNAGVYFNAGQWYDATITLGSVGGARLYIDGVLQSTHSYTGTIQGVADAFWGGWYTGDNFNGTQKELRAWTTERTPSEVIADMTRVYTGSETGLKAYFPTTEGSGNTIQDINSVYTGTITTTNTTPNYIDDVMWVNS
jgi:hypothetical protein